jgi:hypothetical protein
MSGAQGTKGPGRDIEELDFRYRDDGCYGVVVETRAQGPMLLEAEGHSCSREGANVVYHRWLGRPDIVRIAMVRLIYVQGNELLLPDLERMQNVGRR